MIPYFFIDFTLYKFIVNFFVLLCCLYTTKYKYNLHFFDQIFFYASFNVILTLGWETFNCPKTLKILLDMFYRLFRILNLLSFLWFLLNQHRKQNWLKLFNQNLYFCKSCRVSMLYLILPFGILFLGKLHLFSLPWTLPMKPDPPE